MKTLSIILIHTLILLSMGCNGQCKKKMEPIAAYNKRSHAESPEKPRVNVKVNKEFDSKGNLTRYDSSYSYVYKGGSTGIHDSLFPFNSFFKRPSIDLLKTPDGTFFNDSLFDRNFFDDDIFKRLEMNRMLFDGFDQHMDSLMNRFYHRNFVRPSKTI